MLFGGMKNIYVLKNLRGIKMEILTRFQLADEWEQYSDLEVNNSFENEEFVRVNDILKYIDNRIAIFNKELKHKYMDEKSVTYFINELKILKIELSQTLDRIASRIK